MLRQIVVAMLLTIWLFPPAARADARPAEQQQRPQPTARQDRTTTPGGVPGTNDEARRLAERERQAPNLQDFVGGGSIGTTTLIIILLLIIILVLII